VWQAAKENLKDVEDFLVSDRNETAAYWEPAKRPVGQAVSHASSARGGAESDNGPPLCACEWPQLHRLRPLPRVSVEDLSKPWGRAYLQLQEPFILQGALWDWDTEGLDLDALVQAFPG
jgi:hypothetical protein